MCVRVDALVLHLARSPDAAGRSAASAADGSGASGRSEKLGADRHAR